MDYPKFVKQYANVKDIIKTAAANYNDDVKKSVFPEKVHTFNLTDEEREKLEHNVNK